jgi:hypothetical protein
MAMLSQMQLNPKYLYPDSTNPALNLIASKNTNLTNVLDSIPKARREFEFICVLFVVL